jgi:hypothetical protein
LGFFGLGVVLVPLLDVQPSPERPDHQTAQRGLAGRVELGLGLQRTGDPLQALAEGIATEVVEAGRGTRLVDQIVR